MRTEQIAVVYSFGLHVGYLGVAASGFFVVITITSCCSSSSAWGCQMCFKVNVVRVRARQAAPTHRPLTGSFSRTTHLVFAFQI